LIQDHQKFKYSKYPYQKIPFPTSHLKIVKNMKTVLVTGGAGFIGSHLCEKLVNDSYQVSCIDNLLTSSDINIKKFCVIPMKGFKFVDKLFLNKFGFKVGIVATKL